MKVPTEVRDAVVWAGGKNIPDAQISYCKKSFLSRPAAWARCPLPSKKSGMRNPWRSAHSTSYWTWYSRVPVESNS